MKRQITRRKEKVQDFLSRGFIAGRRKFDVTPFKHYLTECQKEDKYDRVVDEDVSEVKYFSSWCNVLKCRVSWILFFSQCRIKWLGNNALDEEFTDTEEVDGETRNRVDDKGAKRYCLVSHWGLSKRGYKFILCSSYHKRICELKDYFPILFSLHSATSLMSAIQAWQVSLKVKVGKERFSRIKSTYCKNMYFCTHYFYFSY